MSDKAWLKPEQVQELRNACYSDRFAGYLQHRNDAIIALLYDAGLRPGELCATTTAMFDPDDGVLRLPSHVQKQYPNANTPPPATIGLAQDEYTADTVRTLKRWLSDRWKDSLYIFPSRKSEAIRTRSLRDMISDVAEESGVEPYVGHGARGEPTDVTPYTFRHSVAYRLLSARDDDTTMYDVRNRLRHRSITTTERHYDHFDVV